MRPYSPAVTREQSRAPHLKSNGDWTSLGLHGTLPEFSIVTREKPQTSHHNSRKTTRFSHHHEMKPFFLGGPREKSQVPSENSIGALTPLKPLKGLQEILIATREESRVLCFNSRRGLPPQGNLECNPEIPVPTGEVHGVSGHKSI